MRKSNNKIYKYLIAFFLIVALSFIYKLLFKGEASGIIYSNKSSEMTQMESSTDEVIIVNTSTDESIDIYLCGAVNNPGVYSVTSGTILNEIVQLAGGMREDAAVDYINLVYELRSNISIYIPTYTEVENGQYNDGIIYRANTTDCVWGVETDCETSQANDRLVNINTASKEELMTLPGVGESTANAIISYRENAVFVNVEDITNVSGIGESKYNRIKNLITVD